MKNIKTLILVGGGHGHLYLLKQLITEKIPDYEVILISSGPRQYYSGMASAYVEGIYNESAISVDLHHMCHLAGVTFIESDVTGFDPEAKHVMTKEGQRINFDLISFDTGSLTMTDHIPGAKSFAKKVKPLGQLTEVKRQIDLFTGESLKITIVGGGASSVELALAMKGYGTQLKRGISMTIVAGHGGILQNYKAKLRRYSEQSLKKQGIEVHSGAHVTKISEDTVVLQNGDQIDHDIVLLATGSVAHEFYRNSGVQVDAKGYMRVNSFLQNIDYPFIFGIGDCIVFDAYDYVTKVGVYAVKEGPILWQNLKAYSQEEPLKTYLPQEKYLSILSTGNKSGVLEYYGLVMHGSWVWQLKNWIDVKFIQQFQ